MTRFSSLVCQQCESRKGPLMGCCQAEELEHIAANKLAQLYRRGQVIFQEGSPAMGMYCVQYGKIKVTKCDGDGREQIVRLAKGGDVLGIHSLLAQLHYSTSAVALDDAVVCFIPRSDFLRLVNGNLQFAASLMQLLGKALGDAEARMLHLAYRPVRERLAEALLLLRDTFQEAGPEPFSIAIAREDLASLVGTAKETAIRLLAELKEEGIIATRGSQITILRQERLARIASLYN